LKAIMLVCYRWNQRHPTTTPLFQSPLQVKNVANARRGRGMGC
jgi:hypothetical protein